MSKKIAIILAVFVLLFSLEGTTQAANGVEALYTEAKNELSCVTVNDAGSKFTEMTVIAQGVNMRVKPGLGYARVGILYYGERVLANANNKTYADGYWWVEIIRRQDGTTGWVAINYLG